MLDRWIKSVFLISMFMLLPACTYMTHPDQVIHDPARDRDWGKAQPTAKDRAAHDIEGDQPFEWWYFDGHLDNGQTFVGVFHLPSFVTNEPAVTFSLYDPDWTRLDFSKSISKEDFEASKQDIHIETPAGFVRRLDDKTYHVRWIMDGLDADFTLTTLAPGWRPMEENGKVNQQSQEFFWVVHQARNRIEGTLTVNGQTSQVTGEGYADHNWGRKKLNKITRRWVWGRIIAGDYTIIYADVEYRDPKVVSRPLYIAKGDKMLVGSGSPAIRQWKFRTHKELKRYYPRRLSIVYEDENISADIEIARKELVEAVNLLKAGGYPAIVRWPIQWFVARPSYFRVIGDYEGEIMIDGKVDNISGQCLYEVMEFD